MIHKVKSIRTALLITAALTLGATSLPASASSNVDQVAAVVAQETPPQGNPPDGAPSGNGAGSSATNPVLTSACGAYLVDGESGAASEGQTYDSANTDESAVCAINSASVSLTDATITKSGDTSSADSSSFYGLNAAVLAGSGSTVSMSGGAVTTHAEGANGVFATGDGSSVDLSDVTIDANGDGAHAVMATLGGVMTLTNVDMNTTGAHSGAIATDRGSGTITVTGGTVTTSGQDSPGIYSTGVIMVSDADISASGAEAAVIEGANSIILTDTTLSSSMADKWGVMIYQSFSGDAEGTDGVFSMTGGSLAYTSANGPLFFVTNSTAYITLSGVDVTAASGTLVQAGATDRWGTSGANGGNVDLTADAQILSGDMVADSISTLSATLQNGSSLTGAINNDNVAKAANLTLNAGSTWTVTADSYLTSLVDPDGISGSAISNIVGNGHNVYYDASAEANSVLNGQTYTLVNGGQLMPKA